MKLLTLNTHSLIENDYKTKLHIFTDTILSEKPDIITLQEVNQSHESPEAIIPHRFQKCGNINLKADNHALKVYELLKEGGLDYHFTWTGIKCGFGKYDEGLASFSLKTFNTPDTITISEIDDYHIWKTRKCLITPFDDFIVCNTHLGWWNDPDEPFYKQWKKLEAILQTYEKTIFLMGDFNSPSHIKNEGYSLVTSSGWYDTFSLAEQKDEGFTISGTPDGWNQKTKARIDYIFSNRNLKIKSCKTLFKHPTVSDHFGVITETR